MQWALYMEIGMSRRFDIAMPCDRVTRYGGCDVEPLRRVQQLDASSASVHCQGGGGGPLPLGIYRVRARRFHTTSLFMAPLDLRGY